VHTPIIINYYFRQFAVSHAEYAEHFGAFVGGYFGSLFALTGVFLLIFTLKSQQLASSQQSFETKYFELIKMHRDNVVEIGMKGRSGRGVFVLKLLELRCALEIIQRIAKESNQPLTERQLQHIAYYCLFYGTGQNSSRMFKISLSEFDSSFIDKVEMELSNEDTKQRVCSERKFSYKPFEGHQSRLGHYYRHLYQMVSYVNRQSNELGIKKDEHIKTIRAQLSTHEQALLLINSLTPIGRNWWEMKLIEEYKLVTNIPRDFFNKDTEFDACSLFKPGYFEWEQIPRDASIV
jgi:hypothetical protein